MAAVALLDEHEQGYNHGCGWGRKCNKASKPNSNT